MKTPTLPEQIAKQVIQTILLKCRRHALLMMLLLPATRVVQAQQQINNGGLEQWEQGVAEHPTYFATIDMLGFSSGTVMKTNIAHSGAYAAKLTSIVSLFSNLPGLLSYSSDTTISTMNGWPFSGKPNKLSFWYQYLPQGGDTASVAIYMTQNINGVSQFVGGGGMYITAATTGYTHGVMDIQYFRPNVQPDSISIQILSSRQQVTPGSTFYIDDLQMVYGNLEVQPIAFANSIVIYPNPASGIVHMKLPGKKPYSVAIRDLLGRIVFTQQVVTEALEVHSEDWTVGQYVVCASNGDEVLSTRLLIGR